MTMMVRAPMGVDPMPARPPRFSHLIISHGCGFGGGVLLPVLRVVQMREPTTWMIAVMLLVLP